MTFNMQVNVKQPARLGALRSQSFSPPEGTGIEGFGTESPLTSPATSGDVERAQGPVVL